MRRIVPYIYKHNGKGSFFKKLKNLQLSNTISIHYLSPISVFFILFLLFTGDLDAFAQKDSLNIVKKLELEELEIISDIEPLVFSQQARLVNLISKNDILNSSSQDIAGILSNRRAIDIRQRGGFGVQGDVSLRASSFDQVLILINGIPISNAQTGHFNLNFPQAAQVIDRIEILEGSAARIYGANAFAGAINIVTKPLDKNIIQLKTEIGQNAFYQLGATVNITKGNNKTFLSFDKSSSDGYIENTDFKIKNLFMQSEWRMKKFLIDIQLGALQKEFGANGFYSVKYPLQFEYNNAYNAALNLNFGKKVVSRISTFWNRHQDQWILNRENPSLYQNFHQIEVVGIKTNHLFENSLGKTRLGTEVKTESIWSTSLGVSQEETKPVPWSKDNHFSRYFQRSNASVFLDHQLNLNNKIYLAFGFLLNLNSESKEKINIYPGIDLSYQLNERFKLKTSLNQSMRLPTFTDLYYSGPANIGNKDLQAEKVNSFELGLAYQKSGLNVDLVYFMRNGKNNIDWVWLSDIEKWQTQNILNQNVSGIETSIDYKPENSSNISHLFINYTFLDVRFKEIEELTKYASTHLKHQVNLGGTFKILPRLYGSVSMSYRDRVGVYQTYDFIQQKYNTEHYKDVILADIKLQYKHPSFTIYLDGLNILNQEYFEYGVIQAGSWFKAGVKINIEP